MNQNGSELENTKQTTITTTTMNRDETEIEEKVRHKWNTNRK